MAPIGKKPPGQRKNGTEDPMKSTLPLIFALTTALTVVAQAQAPNEKPDNGSPANINLPAALLREGQQVVVVGEVSSAPKKIAGVKEEQKMQVAVGPTRTDYTLHVK